ncbi:O-antigen ligase family protein [Gemmatimonadota bacterium]
MLPARKFSIGASIFLAVSLIVGIVLDLSGTALLLLWGGVIFPLLAFYFPAFVLAVLIVSTLLQEMLSVSVGDLGSFNQLLGGILLAVLVTKAFLGRRLRLVITPVTIALAGMLIFMVISFLLFSVGRASPLQDINQFARSFLLFIICLLAIRTDRSIRLFVGSLLVGSLIVASTGLFGDSSIEYGYFQVSGRRGGISGITPHYIEFAVRCMIPLPIILYGLWRRDQAPRITHFLHLVVVLSLSAAILLSGSRGAVIAYWFMVALFLGLSSIGMVKKTLLGVILLSTPFLLPIGEILQSLVLIAQGYVWDPAAADRAELLLLLVRGMDFNHLLWGHGLENFRDGLTGLSTPPHSIWGQTLYELGLIGLAFQLFVVFQVVRLFRSCRREETIALSPTGQMVMGMGVSLFVLFFWGAYENIGFLVGTKVLFILLGGFLAGVRVVQKKQIGEEHAG